MNSRNKNAARRYSSSLIVAILFIVTVSAAQETGFGTLAGSVHDKTTNEALINVNVIV